jgi:SAM-dependent methyltransferase
MIRVRKICEGLFWRLVPVLTPGLRNAQYAYLDVLRRHLGPEVAWLDLGCGRQVVPDWMARSAEVERELVGRAKTAVGIDPDPVALRAHRTFRQRVAGGLPRLPFADGTFDLVTANMVVEHLPDPAGALAEVRRVLKPGGVAILHTPHADHPAMWLARWAPQAVRNAAAWLLENRTASEVFPTFYRLNRPRAIAAAAGRTGLEVARIDLVESTPSTVMFGPLVVLEMLLIRAARRRFLARLRGNMIVVLRRPQTPAVVAHVPLATLRRAA